MTSLGAGAAPAAQARYAVLAALDTDGNAESVLAAAVRVADLSGADVEAVHARADPHESVDWLEAIAGRHGIGLRVLEDPVVDALLGALDDDDVLELVVGARSTSARTAPVGSTVTGILERSAKPIVVVPPGTTSRGAIRRLLIPLEGSDISSRPVRERLECLAHLAPADMELLVVHVFTRDTVPAMVDHAAYDLEILGGEFLARHLPRSTRIAFRRGAVAREVIELATQAQSDLIVLSWSQDNSYGRARVFRQILGGSPVPVLVLPVSFAAPG